ncbi:PilZ domain-containing protein [Halomonas sp. NYA30]
MHLIGLAARSYDPLGAMLLPHRDGTTLGDVNRRVSRVSTLDGGVAVTNRGHSPGDRTVVLSFAGLPRDVVDRARRMVRLHAIVTLSIPDGCFVGVPSEYVERRQELTILITEEA